MFEELFYWTGAFAWFMLSTEIVLWLTGYFVVPCWNRKIRPSISNLRFGLTGKLNLRMSCYDRWDDLPSSSSSSLLEESRKFQAILL